MSEYVYTRAPGEEFRLDQLDPEFTPASVGKRQARQRLKENRERLHELQEAFYADGSKALLIIVQAMDTAGKDGTIEHVLGAFNPQGVQVTPFKVPSSTELAHDFLWRIHQAVPPRGIIGVFNRSQYEDVLVVRVRQLVSEQVWRKRYEQINDFERYLDANGVVIVKLYLHISPEEQAERLRSRQHTPHKQWKFNPGDLEDRQLWPQFMSAYEEALRRCNTEHAPWYVVPANHKWYRNLAVSELLIEVLTGVSPEYPEPVADIDSYVIPPVSS